jgi:hypothetical protein
MKKLAILLTLLSILSLAKAQNNNITLTRGHGNDDIYLDIYKWYYPARNLFRITDFGSVIQRQYIYEGNTNFISLVADPLPGVLIGALPLDDGCYRISHDYGKTWELLNEIDTIVGQVFGGAVTGEYYYQINRGSSIYAPYYYKFSYSADFANNLTPILDSCKGFSIEPGVTPGEIYNVSQGNGTGTYYLSRSKDFGYNFDTIPIHDSIANYLSGKYLTKLSAGTSEGELFLVTVTIELAGSVMSYSIYHSIDYGNIWSLQSQPVFYGDGLQDFTAGRENCSFYYIDYNMDYDNNPAKLSVFYSSDCGKSFTENVFMLTPDVGLKEQNKPNEFISLSPNPATIKVTVEGNYIREDLSIEIFNLQGEKVLNNKYKNRPIIDLDISTLKAGIYIVKVRTKKKIETSKLVVQ